MITYSLFSSNGTLVTGTLSFLLSRPAIFRCSIFLVVVCISFLAFRLSLILEEIILGAEVAAMGLRMILPPKTEATGFCMELFLGTAILDVASCFVAYIQ